MLILLLDKKKKKIVGRKIDEIENGRWHEKKGQEKNGLGTIDGETKENAHFPLVSRRHSVRKDWKGYGFGWKQVWSVEIKNF